MNDVVTPTDPTAGDPAPDHDSPAADESGAGPTDAATTDAGGVTDERPPQVPRPPRPVDRSSDPASRRNWAAAAHWSAVVGALLGGVGFLGPLVVWLVKRDQDTWVAAHAVESLNFQLTWFLGAVVGGLVGVVLTVLTIGVALVVLIPLALAALVAWFVLPLRAAMAASRVEEVRYPLTIRFITV